MAGNPRTGFVYPRKHPIPRGRRFPQILLHGSAQCTVSRCRDVLCGAFADGSGAAGALAAAGRRDRCARCLASRSVNRDVASRRPHHQRPSAILIVFSRAATEVTSPRRRGRVRVSAPPHGRRTSNRPREHAFAKVPQSHPGRMIPVPCTCDRPASKDTRETNSPIP